MAWRWDPSSRSWAQSPRVGLPGSGPLPRPPVDAPAPTAPARHSVTRNITALLVAQAFTWVAAMGLSVAQARYLGPSGIGKLGLAWSLWLVAGVLVTFGTPTLITLEASKNAAKGAALTGTAIRFQALPTAVAFIALQLYGYLSDFDGTTQTVLALVGITVFFQLCAASLRAFSYGLEQMSASSFIDVLHRVGFVVLVIAVLYAGFGVVGSATTNLLVSISNLVALTWVMRKQTPIHLTGTFHDYRLMLRQSRGYFANEAIMVMYQQVDVIVVSILLTTTSLGYYTTATTLFGTLLFLPNIVNTGTFPVLSRLHASDPAEGLRFLEASLGTMMLVSGPIIAGTGALGSQVIDLLYGDEFAPSGPILRLLGLVLMFTIPLIILGRYALVIGRQRAWAMASVVATVLTVPCDIVLVRLCERWFDNGALAGAITYVITEGFLTVFGLVVIAPQLLNRRVGIRFAKTAIAMGVMYAITWQLRHRFILIPPLVGGAAYLVVVLALRVLSQDEIAAVKRQVARRLPGRSTATA